MAYLGIACYGQRGGEGGIVGGVLQFVGLAVSRALALAGEHVELAQLHVPYVVAAPAAGIFDLVVENEAG